MRHLTVRHIELDEPASRMSAELVDMLHARQSERGDADLVVDA
jgi:hypothetical protein